MKNIEEYPTPLDCWVAQTNKADCHWLRCQRALLAHTAEHLEGAGKW